MLASDRDPNNPTGKQYAVDFCDEMDLDPSMWGHINNVALDGYHTGRTDGFNEAIDALRNILDPETLEKAIKVLNSRR